MKLDELTNMVLDMYTLGIIISFNILFFVFVHDLNDLTPNLAILFLSVFSVTYLLIRIFGETYKITKSDSHTEYKIKRINKNAS